MDVRTLILLVIPETAVFGLLHGVLWLRWRDHASLWWLAANWLGASAAIPILTHWLPAWVIIYTPVKTPAVSASLLLWLGLRCMAHRALPLREFAIAAFVYVGLFCVLQLLTMDIGFTLVLSSITLCIVNLGMAVDLAKSPLAGHRLASKILTIMFLCHGLFYLFRSTTSFLARPAARFVDMSGLQNMTVLVLIFTVTLWNLVTLWLTVQQHRGLAMTRADA